MSALETNQIQEQIQKQSPTKILSVPEATIQSLETYFANCGDQQPVNIYQLILDEVEKPLMQMLMEKYRYNQSKVSRVLGLSRGTTRKLLKKYGLID